MITKKKSNVTFYAEPELKVEIKQVADASGRSLAGQVKFVIKDWLRQRRQKDDEEVFSDLTF
jgi:hypothetical protein